VSVATRASRRRPRCRSTRRRSRRARADRAAVPLALHRPGAHAELGGERVARSTSKPIRWFGPSDPERRRAPPCASRPTQLAGGADAGERVVRLVAAARDGRSGDRHARGAIATRREVGRRGSRERAPRFTGSALGRGPRRSRQSDAGRRIVGRLVSAVRRHSCRARGSRGRRQILRRVRRVRKVGQLDAGVLPDLIAMPFGAHRSPRRRARGRGLEAAGDEARLVAFPTMTFTRKTSPGI
jgi:hypothetical protein